MKVQTQSYKNAKRLAVSSLLCGISFIFMYIGSLSGIFDLCAVVVGALCTAMLVMEIGGAYPLIAASVCGVLCMLLLPDKFSGLEYIVLGGLYPVVKSLFERFGKIISWVAKLAFFNVGLTACIALARFVLGMTGEEYIAFRLPVYVAGNVFFIIYDIALTMYISLYIVRLRPKLKLSDLRVLDKNNK